MYQIRVGRIVTSDYIPNIVVPIAEEFSENIDGHDP